MRRDWKTLLIVAVVAAIGLSIVAVAYGATQVKRSPRGRAACAELMGNPKAVEAMQALRDEHRQDMQAWVEKYSADPSSAEARAALKALRQEHWNDMKALFEKFGIALPKGAGPGACGGQRGMMGAGGNGSCGGASGGCAGPGPGSGSQGSGYNGSMMGGGMMGGASY